MYTQSSHISNRSTPTEGVTWRKARHRWTSVFKAPPVTVSDRLFDPDNCVVMASPTKDGLLKGYASLCKILTFMLHMLALTALGPGLESDLIAELQLSRMCTCISGSQL